MVQQLPPPHYRTLEYLTRHLARVAENSASTGMTAKNVAIVWAPNLLRCKELEFGGVAALQVTINTSLLPSDVLSGVFFFFLFFSFFFFIYYFLFVVVVVFVCLFLSFFLSFFRRWLIVLSFAVTPATTIFTKLVTFSLDLVHVKLIQCMLFFIVCYFNLLSSQCAFILAKQ